MVNWGLVTLDGLVKFILVNFGLGKAKGLVKFSLFDFSSAKVDVTNKQKNIHDDMLSCCETEKRSKKIGL